MNKTILTGLLAAALSGCSTIGKLDLENRVTCTVDRTEALYVSKYGPVGVASKVSDQDARVICGEAK